MNTIEIKVDLYDVFANVEVEELFRHFTYEEIIQTMDTKKFLKALGESLYEHDPYEIFDAIKHELNLDELK